LWLRGYLANARRWAAFGATALLLGVFVAPARNAHADDAFNTEAAVDTRLAYVTTGVPDVDEMSKAGLTGLGLYLKARTSYDPKEPVAVNLEKDDLAFFPLLYWPTDPREPNLSPKALAKVGDYMRSG